MVPSTPPPAAGEDHPALPVSHPRSSPRSPPRDGAPQPPISPPRQLNNINPAPQVVPSLSSSSTITSSDSISSSVLSALSSQTSLARSLADEDDVANKQSLPMSQSAPDHRTPNVYINGLPPNFPEDQLYAMTAEFGPVISVRTFTRHVSDRPSGYGFVLFESVDSAEKCIEALRRYRNLHPSFSKQVHKIPGTAYANVPAASLASDAVSADSFKCRMERLKDTSSTNLYIEGLPLSIDEPTLSALVAPYMIKSSRFFQTRLSHPPRIIAFVRLETRQACEDIIERLHGRMVRGWNDTGSRISVRFADSAEQRELRQRSERTGREGDASPARLTMAQAALLSLRGQHAATTPTTASRLPPPIGSPDLAPSPVSNDRSQLPLHPMTAQYSQPSSGSQSPSVDINLSVMRNANAGAGSFTPLAQHLMLQAEIDAQRQALADLRLRVDRRSPFAPQSEFAGNDALVGAPLNRLNAISSKEFVPRGLVGRQLQQRQPQVTMSEDEFHQSNRLPCQQFVGGSFGDEAPQAKILYDSDENAKRARTAAAFAMPPPGASHTRSTTLPPQFMHNVNEPVEHAQARLNNLLPPSLRQTSNGVNSGPLNIAVPAPKQASTADDSPLLVPSPALTYNSSASSAALSPATPFFGTFANGEGAFTGAGVYRPEGEGNGKMVNDPAGLNYGGVGVGVGLEHFRAQ